ncbi:hypothetical protein LCGC14_0421430 [marine sediment metagenome]|uniref:Uncharacterized protein n=1 Tax=marine sediment metagenome TaxID=412755 RepID=A0A0F9VCY2_9ZZZZ
MATLNTLVIRETFKIDGVLTDLASVPVFTAEDSSLSGVIRDQDSAVVVAADTALTKIATGTYRTTFTESPNNYTYTYWIKWVYDGDTFYDEHSLAGSGAALTTTAKFKSYIGETSTTYDSLIDDLVNRATSALEAYCGHRFGEDTYRHIFDGDGTTSLFLPEFPVTKVSLLSVSLQDVIRVTNTSSDAWNAYVEVVESATDPSVSSTMNCVIQGGADDGSDALTLSSYTLTSLVAAINALAKGWSATLNVSNWGIWDAPELLPNPGLSCINKYAYVQTPYKSEIEFDIKGQRNPPYNGNVGELRLPVGFSEGKQNVVVRYTAGYPTVPDDLEQIAIDLINIYFRGRNKDLSVKSERLGDHSITHAEDARNIPKQIQVRLAPYKRWR